MIQPIGEFKVNLEKVIQERQIPMNHIAEGYALIKEAEEQQNNVINITNINEAIAIKYGRGNGDLI